MEKTALFLPLSFWSKVILTLDRKVEMLCKQYGYGNVRLDLPIHKHHVLEAIFSDEIRVRGLVRKEEYTVEEVAEVINPLDK